MTFSTRVSIQWPPELAEEKSSTMVFTSPGDLFVDVRILSAHYPYQKQETDLPFTEVFQWVIVGKEESIADTNKITFHHEVDSMAIAELAQTGKPVADCMGGPDVGNFFDIPGSQDRKETGSMVNPDTGKVQDYIEIWRSLDPELHTPHKLARESADTTKLVFVFDIENDKYHGRCIRLGNWIQGALYDKTSAEHPLHVVRAHRLDGSSGWEYLIEYGESSMFPMCTDAVKDQIYVSSGGIEWKCVEKC